MSIAPQAEVAATNVTFENSRIQAKCRFGDLSPLIECAPAPSSLLDVLRSVVEELRRRQKSAEEGSPECERFIKRALVLTEFIVHLKQKIKEGI